MVKLDNAVCEVGFFYLTGHGISQRLLDDLQSVSRQLFALSEQEKLSVQMANSPHFRGYNRAGSEIDFSAMAGVVGGSGLGDLAICYGYQRFDNTLRPQR